MLPNADPWIHKVRCQGKFLSHIIHWADINKQWCLWVFYQFERLFCLLCWWKRRTLNTLFSFSSIEKLKLMKYVSQKSGSWAWAKFWCKYLRKFAIGHFILGFIFNNRQLIFLFCFWSFAVSSFLLHVAPNSGKSFADNIPFR